MQRMPYSKVRNDKIIHVRLHNKSNINAPILILRIYNPMCGKDNKTYSNQWELDCKAVEKRCKGECPCKEECLIPK